MPSRRPEPEYEIDLHGLTRTQAIQRVRERLSYYRSGNVKLVRIVTGRGSRSPDGKALLFPVVKQWLRERGRKDLGVKDVQEDRDGGALLVWLGADD